MALAAAGVEEAAHYADAGADLPMDMAPAVDALTPVAGKRAVREQVELLRLIEQAGGGKSMSVTVGEDEVVVVVRRKKQARPSESEGARVEASGTALTDADANAGVALGAEAAAREPEEEEEREEATQEGEEAATWLDDGEAEGAADAVATEAARIRAEEDAELAALRSGLEAARETELRLEAAIATPCKGAEAADRVASINVRFRITTVKNAWFDFLKEKGDGWLASGASPSFDQTWQFVRDKFMNARRVRVLRSNEKKALCKVTIECYVLCMRDWLWPELFPQLVDRASGKTVGEWRSFWERIMARVSAEFSDGGTMEIGQLVASNAGVMAAGLQALATPACVVVAADAAPAVAAMAVHCWVPDADAGRAVVEHWYTASPQM